MTHFLNGGLLMIALVLAMVAVAGFSPTSQPATAAVTPNAGFQRIVSLSIVADAALAELCEPQRVVGVSAWSTGPVARRWTGTPQLRGLDDLESVIALRPDVVLLNSDGGDRDRLERLRAAGIRVEVLGAMRGLATYSTDLEQIGTLLGRGDEARLISLRLRERMARVADPARSKPRALYVATYGETLFGGSVGTSYHDVILASGCSDAAADTFTDWPQYGVEQVISLAPDIIVTKRGMAAVLRTLPGMSVLTATHYVELDGALLEDPGPRLLEAAEALRDAVLAIPSKQATTLPAASPNRAISR